MEYETRFFGTVDLSDDKVLTFEEGIMGFPDMKRWTILYDKDRGENAPVSWLQSLDESGFAMPIISPFSLVDTYSPLVEDELLAPLGNFKDEDLLIFLSLSVPLGRPADTTANFKAPFIINPENRRGIQIIVDNEDYDIHTKVADLVKKTKA